MSEHARIRKVECPEQEGFEALAAITAWQAEGAYSGVMLGRDEQGVLFVCGLVHNDNNAPGTTATAQGELEKLDSAYAAPANPTANRHTPLLTLRDVLTDEAIAVGDTMEELDTPAAREAQLAGRIVTVDPTFFEEDLLSAAAMQDEEFDDDTRPLTSQEQDAFDADLAPLIRSESLSVQLIEPQAIGQFIHANNNMPHTVRVALGKFAQDQQRSH